MSLVVKFFNFVGVDSFNDDVLFKLLIGLLLTTSLSLIATLFRMFLKSIKLEIEQESFVNDATQIWDFFDNPTALSHNVAVSLAPSYSAEYVSTEKSLDYPLPP